MGLAREARAGHGGSARRHVQGGEDAGGQQSPRGREAGAWRPVVVEGAAGHRALRRGLGHRVVRAASLHSGDIDPGRSVWRGEDAVLPAQFRRLTHFRFLHCRAARGGGPGHAAFHLQRAMLRLASEGRAGSRLMLSGPLLSPHPLPLSESPCSLVRLEPPTMFICFTDPPSVCRFHLLL
eukprot:scaffold5004_cov110-Isochrysis_galbana.AAC.5